MATDVLAPPPGRLDGPDRHPLEALFAPVSVAVVGATDEAGSVGRTLMANLILNPFGGTIFPISPGRRSVHGIEAYPSLAAVRAPIDLAVVAAPPAAVPDVLAEGREAGVKAAIVMSADPDGARLERRIREGLRPGSPRVLGPGSVGVACPRTGLNATFAPAMIRPGKVGILSQSGALLTALLGGEGPEGVGCSVFVSVGALADISWAEWLDYLAQDAQTECIGVYLEQLGDARAFFAAARRAARVKPVLLLRGGKGAPAGASCAEVFEEACRTSGVLCVERLGDLLRVADHLTTRPVPKGRRLAIVTNARGPAVLAADALRVGGGSPATPAAETASELARLLPRWDRQGPVDVGDDADADRFVWAAAVAARDPNADALLALLTPQATVDPLRAAEGLRRVARACDRPVLACWLWGAATPESLKALRDGDVPTFRSPESAVRMFGYLWRHAEAQRCLATYQWALAAEGKEAAACGRVEEIIAAAQGAGRPALTPAEAREALSAYGLPVRERRVAAGEAAALGAAEALGYPVLVELGAGPGGPVRDGEGVQLRAGDADALRRTLRALRLLAVEHYGAAAPDQVTLLRSVPPGALEVVVSGATDPEVGPVMRLRAGGAGAEGTFPVATALAPLLPWTAREMIQRLPLQAGPGAAEIDLGALERFLVRLSRLVTEQPAVRDVTIDPLLVWEGGALAGAVRVALNPREPVAAPDRE
jgi:acetyltransferase